MQSPMSMRFYRFKARYLKDKRGSATIEFSAVLVPFIALMFASIAIGLYFFTQFSLEYAVGEAARDVRTGKFQIANQTQSEFKAAICGKAIGVTNCDANIRINILEFADFNNINVPSCLDSDGALLDGSSGGDLVPGASGNVVFILACYEWTLAGVFPYFNLGNMNNGSALLQASTAFRTEPFGE